MNDKTKSTKTRVQIYFDGANFHHGLRSFNKKYSDFHVSFKKFGEKIAGERELLDIHYYSMHYPRVKNIPMHNKQKIFFKNLKSQGIKVHLAYMNSGSNKVKGDDIMLALDMFEGAINNEYDVGILVSGDGDFLPLIRKIHKYHKKVELWYFDARTSKKLISACDVDKIITKSQVRKYYMKSKKL